MAFTISLPQYVDPTCPFDCCQIWKGIIPENIDFQYEPQQQSSTLSLLQLPISYSRIEESSFQYQQQIQSSFPEGNLVIDERPIKQPAAGRRKSANQNYQKLRSSSCSGNIIYVNNDNGRNNNIAKKRANSASEKPRKRQYKKRRSSSLLISSKQVHLESTTLLPIPMPSSSSSSPLSDSNTEQPALIINLVLCSDCGRYCLSDSDLQQHTIKVHGPIPIHSISIQ